MNTAEKLERVVALCKGSVTVNYNEHTTNYETVEQYLRDSMFNRFADVSEKLRKDIVEKNQVIEVQAYPETPVDFFLVVHHDLDTALDEMLNVLEARDGA